MFFLHPIFSRDETSKQAREITVSVAQGPYLVICIGQAVRTNQAKLKLTHRTPGLPPGVPSTVRECLFRHERVEPTDLVKCFFLVSELALVNDFSGDKHHDLVSLDP